MTALTLPGPYLLLLGDVAQRGYAKTAFGLRDWAPEKCLGEYRLPGAISTGLPELSPAAAAAQGAKAMVVGVAPVGGAFASGWIACLIEALEAGLDLISGLHAPLATIAGVGDTAERLGRSLIDIRRPPSDLPIGTGRKRSGKRLLTVGTDCALGKKYTALAIDRAFRDRGVSSDFRATGQTGILIAGGGIPIDAVVSDFVAGAAEALSPDAAPDHWDVIEGQGSLFHPAYAGVSLGLLHGSQPDVLVLCHEAGRQHMLGFPDFAVPALSEAISLNLMLARRVNPAVRCAGISLNTVDLPADEADRLLHQIGERSGLPCADPIRGGERFDELVEAALVRR